MNIDFNFKTLYKNERISLKEVFDKPTYRNKRYNR